LFTAGVFVEGTAFTMAFGAGPPVDCCVAVADDTDSVATDIAAAKHAAVTLRILIELPPC
jgi:hypothetical protein